MHASIEVKGQLGLHAQFVALGMKHRCSKQSNDAKDWESTTSLARMEATAPQSSPGPSHFTRLSPQTGCLRTSLPLPSWACIRRQAPQKLHRYFARNQCGRDVVGDAHVAALRPRLRSVEDGSLTGRALTPRGDAHPHQSILTTHCPA